MRNFVCRKKAPIKHKVPSGIVKFKHFDVENEASHNDVSNDEESQINEDINKHAIENYFDGPSENAIFLIMYTS